MRRVGVLRQRARQAIYSYNFVRAHAILGEALQVLDRLPDEVADDRDVVFARVLVLVSLAYVQTEGAPPRVGQRLLDAAQDLAAGLPDEMDRAELAGHVLQQRGYLLVRAGQVEEAQPVWAAAAERLRKALDAGVGDPYVLASLHLNRSLAFIHLGQITAARKAIHRCVAVCDRHGLSGIAIKARHNLGYLAYLTGDIPTALHEYARSSAASAAESPGMLPVIRLDQARALLAGGLVEEAARHLDEARPLLRKQKVGQDAAEVEVVRAAAALLSGDLRLARRCARQAERMFLRRGNTLWAGLAALAALRAETARALDAGRVPAGLPVDAVKLADHLRGLMLEDEAALALMLAVRLELRRKDTAAAEVLLDQVPAARPTTPIDHKMLYRLCRAELAVARGDGRAALAQARSGLAELAKARDRMGGLELVCGTALHGLALGELAIRVVAGDGRPDARRLFTWLERTRAQVYRYEPLPAIDDPVMAERAAELRRLRRAAQAARLEGRAGAALERQTVALEREIARDGWHTSLWGKPRPVATVRAVAERLGDAALVNFAVLHGGVVAVVVAGGRVRVAHLGEAATATENAARLHADLNALAPDTLPGMIAEVVHASAVRNAVALDEQLLRPLAKVIGDRDVVVVPTGALYAVPWGSLPSLHGTPVVVAPSATAWLSAATGGSAGGRIVLARGPELTGVVAEDAVLRQIYPDALVMGQQDSAVADVLSALDGAELAHLAAHGVHEPTNALFSRLELADGPMYAYDVARLRQPPRQVVLAACELALSYVRPGDEALGYAGALLASGVRTVVAATSRVGDVAAAQAMTGYHRALAAGRRPAAALAEIVAADPYRRPFVCLGSG